MTWATNAAKRIVDTECVTATYGKEQRVAIIIAEHAAPLLALLAESRRGHYHCDDSHYCCPMCTSPDHVGLVEGEVHTPGKPCDCGADAWNAKIDEALKRS